MARSLDIDLWCPSSAQIAVRDAAARGFGVAPWALVGRSRRQPIARARQAAAWAIRHRWPKLTWRQVARTIGMHDHSSAIEAVRAAENWRGQSAEFRAATDALVAGEPVDPDVRLALAAPPKRPKLTGVIKAHGIAPIGPRSGTWCAQCDGLVGPERQAACRSRWCSLKVAA